MKPTILLLCLISGLFSEIKSESIVFFSPISSASHRASMFPLAEKLAEKGHNVTYISSQRPKKSHSKVRDYVPTSLDGWMDEWTKDVDIYADRKNNEMKTSINYHDVFGMMMCEQLYTDEEFIKWVKIVKVDLVILDSLSSECVYGMVGIWGSKLILFHTFTEMAYFMESYGMSDESDWLPSLDLIEQPGPQMTFFQRIQNKFVPVVFDYLRRNRYFPRLEALSKEKLGVTDLPNFIDIERNTSMVFINVHYSMDYPRSLPPNVKHVGGIAATGKENIPLPKDLEAFLSKGNGFFFISFGSWGDFTRVDEHIKRAFIDAINSFPKLQFIWKVSNESLLQEFPHKNVFITQWVPQQTLLANPKIKGFMTQTGLISYQEAVTHAVPLICFPFFDEQDYNSEVIHRKEAGIKLEITRVTKDELGDAINKLLHDPKYKRNMKTMSTLFKERPEKPLDTALWWTEFVLKHTPEELSALRPLGIGQPWWKKRGIDVWLTVFVVTITLLSAALFCVWKLVLKICCASSPKSNLQHKKLQ